MTKINNWTWSFIIILIVVSLTTSIFFIYSYYSSKISILKEEVKTLDARLQSEIDKNNKYSNKSYVPIDYQVVSTSKTSEDFYFSFNSVENLPEEIISKFKKNGKLKGIGFIGEDNIFYYFYIGLGEKPIQYYECDVRSVNYNKSLDVLQIIISERYGDHYLGNRDIETYPSTLIGIKKKELLAGIELSNYQVIYQR